METFAYIFIVFHNDCLVCNEDWKKMDLFPD
jgi:hypothetical protein